jgi:ABC-type branched-subunit amino acid transport system ATPase component
MALSREIHVMHHGEMIASGSPDEVVRNPAVLDCYLGEEAL